MNERDKLLRDVDTLNEVIRLEWVDLNALPLTSDDRRTIRNRIARLVAELAQLIARLDDPAA
jgi:hypothetical protein